MTNQDHVLDLLPFYGSGALDDGQRRQVEDHLATCESCRSELALWTAIGDAVVDREASLPAPPARVLDRALRDLGSVRPGLLARAWQLLNSQRRVVRREIWLTSALVMSIGYLVALVIGSKEQGGNVIAALAPVLAAAGVAMIYGPDNDPALELALATPTSPWQVLLARLALVFGYDLSLALAATIGLLAILPVDLLGGLILQWLAPMTLLSALALVLSLWIGTNTAVSITLLAWLARWIARGLLSQFSPAIDLGTPAESFAQTYLSLWTNPQVSLSLAALLFATALLLVGRREAVSSRGRMAE